VYSIVTRRVKDWAQSAPRYPYPDVLSGLPPDVSGGLGISFPVLYAVCQSFV